MNNNFYCVIMAGGGGTRVWPVSRIERPKQFIDILGVGRTFIQMTFDRMSKIVPVENILVVTSVNYHSIVKEQLPEIPEENILLEPYRRNTAPCIAYATYKLLTRNPDATVIAVPADSLIINEDIFCETVINALKYASTSDNLFTIGIKPTRPDTNFGYIQFNRHESAQIGPSTLCAVKTFTEKPNLELATIFLETGEFLWNSGMFIWNLKTIKSELEFRLPEITSLFKGGEAYYYTPAESEFILKVYQDCPSISIDYGVLERTDKVWVISSDFGWSDVGTWSSIYANYPVKDKSGNLVRAQEVLLDNVNNSIIKSSDPKKLIVLRDLDDFMVIDTDNILVVCPRNDKAIKAVVTELTTKEKSRYL